MPGLLGSAPRPPPVICPVIYFSRQPHKEGVASTFFAEIQTQSSERVSAQGPLTSNPGFVPRSQAAEPSPQPRICCRALQGGRSLPWPPRCHPVAAAHFLSLPLCWPTCKALLMLLPLGSACLVWCCLHYFPSPQALTPRPIRVACASLSLAKPGTHNIRLSRGAQRTSPA